MVQIPLQPSWQGIISMQGTIKVLYKAFPWLAGLVLFFFSLFYYNQSRKGVIWSDAEGYYLYLPAVFIYNGFEKVPIISGQMQPYKDSKKVYTKYTCGVAIMEAPFFALAQATTFITDKDTGGYTSINNLAIRLAAIFYALWGLVLLRNYLAPRYGKAAVLVALTGLLFGTNLFYYTVREPGMSHAYLFFLFALFIILTPKVLAQPNFKNAIFLGLLFGLITLIRPTNCLIALYLLLYQVTSFQAFKNRVQFFFSKLKVFWVVPVLMFLVFVPQLLYWHYISGHFLIYSYDQEGFIYWKAPKILLVLFDVQNGWLLYSPMAIFGIIGLLWGIAKKETGMLAIGLILTVATYIFSSWWAWWFGGAFGHRCFVEFYALLALPLAFLINKLLTSRQAVLKGIFALLCVLFIFYNLRITVLYAPPWDGPNWTWERYGEVLKQVFLL